MCEAFITAVFMALFMAVFDGSSHEFMTESARRGKERHKCYTEDTATMSCCVLMVLLVVRDVSETGLGSFCTGFGFLSCLTDSELIPPLSLYYT